MRLHAIQRHARRYRQIAAVAMRHELGHLLERAGLARLLPRWHRLPAPPRREAGGVSTWRRLRLALEELGGTFIKSGQMLSARRDLLPHELADELEKLQDEVPALAYPRIKQVLEAELGGPPEQVFAEFQEEAVAAGSIAQVHFARLRSGEEVAVKVQRPGVAEQMETDFEILFAMAGLLERRAAWAKDRGVVQMVREFAETTRQEMDFTLEGANADRFRGSFADERDVHVPKIHWEHTTKRVLTLERIVGTKLSHVEEIEARGLDRKEVARRGAWLYLKQILEDGFFHADPHPGNIWVEEGGRIAFLDFGIVGRIHDRLRRQIADLFVAVVRRDTDAVVDTLLGIGAAQADADREALARDVSHAVDNYYSLPLERLRPSEMTRELMALAQKYGVPFPPDFALAAKTVTILDGVARELDPTFNFAEVAGPFAAELVRERLSPGQVLSDLLADLREVQRLLRSTPRRLGDLLDQARAGRLTVRVEPRHVEGPLEQLQQMANRLSFSIIVASVILGSALLLHAEAGPRVWGLPIVAVAGFGAALVLGFWLLVSMLRHGRL